MKWFKRNSSRILRGPVGLRRENILLKEIELVDQLSLFSPNSAGQYEDLARLTLLAANQTFPLLSRLLISLGKKPTVLMPVEAFCTSAPGRAAAVRLRNLFNKYGSDKSTDHNYELVYGQILGDVSGVFSMLEIGMGTNNTDVVSNMSALGRPGASLRAFAEFLPAARVFGADVDREILFQTPQIKTFFVDQTDLESFVALDAAIEGEVNMIIDDGLHSPNANIAVLDFALRRLAPGGWVIIEDIAERTLPLWQVISALIPESLSPYLLKTKSALVFAVQKRCPT